MAIPPRVTACSAAGQSRMTHPVSGPDARSKSFSIELMLDGLSGACLYLSVRSGKSCGGYTCSSPGPYAKSPVTSEVTATAVGFVMYAHE